MNLSINPYSKKRLTYLFKYSISLLFVLFFSVHSIAQTNIQDLLRSKDWSSYKVDMLSDDDIIKYKDYLDNAGISETQAEQMAIQRGLPSSEVLKLKARMTKLTNGSSKPNAGKSTPYTNRTADSSGMSKPPPANANNTNMIFGSELFTNSNIASEQNLRIATPKNYTIGPDDEIAIDVFGYQEVATRLTVSAEGSINIPNVGVIPVNGLTVEQATKRIREKMIHNGYASIASGQSQIQVNISKIRSIKVTVIGEAKRPGTYTVSSLSTLFNALYAAGGIAERGSLRTIELIRENKVIQKLDAYEFLLRGDQSHNVRLMDQDVIRIPVVKIQVKLKGEVKRPGIYEMLPSETLDMLLEYAGGFSDKAYTATVHIQAYTDKEKQVKDVKQGEFDSYHFSKGEEVLVGKVLDRFTNRVVIEGAIFRPGEYELTQGLTLSQLISNADGIKGDAFKERGELYRLSTDLSKEVVAFNVSAILNKQNDIVLQKDDSVSIASVKDFKEEYNLTVDGEVKKPGVYSYYDGITLKDLLFQTGGFTDGASPQHIEVARRIIGDSSNSKRIAEVIDISTEKDLGLKGNDIKLQPWDVIIVRSRPGYKAQITVKVQGEVQYPSTYVLASKDDRVSDIIARAGGLTLQADRKGANITRINTSALKQNGAERVQKLQHTQTQADVQDTTNNQLIEDITKPTVTIGLDLDKIMTNTNSLEDVILQEGDIITVPKARNVVKINGEVMFPTEVVYKAGESLDYYIDKAGGFAENARKSKVYVLNSNGSAAKTRKFLFFRSYPKIEAGSEILVPKIPDHTGRGLTTAEWLAIASGLASIAGVVIAIVNVSKK